MADQPNGLRPEWLLVAAAIGLVIGVSWIDEQYACAHIEQHSGDIVERDAALWVDHDRVELGHHHIRAWGQDLQGSAERERHPETTDQHPGRSRTDEVHEAKPR